ncbi:MAG: hypothetical protein R2710_21770 [Acidimicrobiales bacterium]
MVWAEDGYWFSLAMERVGADVELGDLTSVAESLERIVQPDLVKRLGDPFMFDQAGTVERWLDNNALAPGWDPQPLIDAVPGGEFTVAFFTRQFVACTWGAEWLDAARAGDDARRQRAIDALSSGARWSVVQAEARAYEAIGAERPTSASNGFGRSSRPRSTAWPGPRLPPRSRRSAARSAAPSNTQRVDPDRSSTRRTVLRLDRHTSADAWHQILIAEHLFLACHTLSTLVERSSTGTIRRRAGSKEAGTP